MCQAHWDRLRQAIQVRGLSGLVAKDAKENYDPLMNCFWMISAKAVEFGGLYMMTGDYCPVCEAVKHTADVVDEQLGRARTVEERESWWIDGPADAVLAYARELELVPKTQ